MPHAASLEFARDVVQRLATCGVAVDLVRYDGVMHSFVTFLDALPAARVAVDRIGAHLRSWLA